MTKFDAGLKIYVTVPSRNQMLDAFTFRHFLSGSPQLMTTSGHLGDSLIIVEQMTEVWN